MTMRVGLLPVKVTSLFKRALPRCGECDKLEVKVGEM